MDAAEPLSSWVGAARAGSRDALDRLYRRFAPVVHGLLLARVSRADADDLTQDVFETAFTRLPELREDAAFPGWIIAIARRAAADAQRRFKPLHDTEPDTLTAPGNLEDRIEAERALQAIRALPEAYRDTLLLRLVEGLDGPEIAARTGLTTGSVRVNLHRGMALLRTALAEHARGTRT